MSISSVARSVGRLVREDANIVKRIVRTNSRVVKRQIKSDAKRVKRISKRIYNVPIVRNTIQRELVRARRSKRRGYGMFEPIDF